MRLELNDFTGQPCKSRVAYEFLPKKDAQLNLEQVAKKLKENEVYIEIEAPYLLMLKVNGKDVSLFKSGKIIVKSTQNKTKARKIAEKLIMKMN
ncbi:MAG TPA: hypothetical protein VFF13_05170 [archaeon]|nr:hypothetical protein [archaeon]